jgi:hypothetical protein
LWRRAGLDAGEGLRPTVRLIGEDGGADRLGGGARSQAAQAGSGLGHWRFMSAPPSVFYQPDWDPGRRIWKSAYFVLRGSRDIRDLVSVQPATSGAFAERWSDAHLVSHPFSQ